MEYRTFVPGVDDAAVLKLRANVWGAGHPHTTPEFFHWLLRDTPAGPGSGVMMLDGQEVMGFAGLLPRYVDSPKASLVVAQGLDYMVHTKVRSGAGAFRIASVWAQLARELGFGFAIGFPNAQSREMLIRPRVGWKEAFWLELMVRPLTRAAIPQVLVRRVPRQVAEHGTALIAALAAARAGWTLRQRPRGDAFTIEQFDPRFDALWQQARGNSIFGIRRDAAYLNWRFVRQPIYSYIRVGWEWRGEILGYAIASGREILGVPSMLIVDLLAAPKAEGRIIEALLAELVSRARSEGRQLLASLAIARSPLQGALARCGFLAVPRRFDPKPFVMITHDFWKRAGPALSENQWYFTWADTDVV